MKKKLLAMAVAGALAAPVVAFAQSNVTIYGRANLGIDTYKATGSAAGGATDFNARTRVYDSGSRLGFTGTENLGGGMSAYFRIESGVNIDAGTATTQSGAANSSAGTLATRDSFVGIKGGWGEVSWGRQSMFWANGLNAQTGASYINASADGILTGGGILTAPVTRQSNVMYYTSPRLAGMWDIAVGYSPNASQETAAAGPLFKSDIYNINVKFRSGPWYGQGDWARNKVTATQKKVGYKLGVSYGYAPDSRFGVIYQRLKQDGAPAGVGTTVVAGDNIRNGTWVFNLEHAVNAWRLYAEYAKVGTLKGATGATGNSGTSITAWTLGAKYMFSKRTGVYASYNSIRNGSAAFGDFTGGGYTSVAMGAANAGADPRVWAVGMMHNF